MMAYTATGTGGNDTLNQSGDTGPGTIVGLAGNDVCPDRHRSCDGGWWIGGRSHHSPGWQHRHGDERN